MRWGRHGRLDGWDEAGERVREGHCERCARGRDQEEAEWREGVGEYHGQLVGGPESSGCGLGAQDAWNWQGVCCGRDGRA